MDLFSNLQPFFTFVSLNRPTTSEKNQHFILLIWARELWRHARKLYKFRYLRDGWPLYESVFCFILIVIVIMSFLLSEWIFAIIFNLGKEGLQQYLCLIRWNRVWVFYKNIQHQWRLPMFLDVLINVLYC